MPAVPEAPAGTLPTSPISGVPGPGGGDLLGPGGAAGSAGSPTTSAALPAGASGAGVPGIPGAEEIARRLASATPQERRRLARHLWDKPLKGKELARMRRFVEAREACLDMLPEPAQRVILLRTGLAGGPPATRRAIARRLGVSVTRVLRLERRGIVRLARSCDVPAANAFVLGQSTQSVLDAASFSAVAVEEAADRSGVLGVQETRLGSPRQPDPHVMRDGDGAAVVSNTLLAFLAAALAIIAAALLATRGAAAPLPLAAPAQPGEARPLLFLDVDGVIALACDPFRPNVRHGAWYRFGMTEIYVSLRAGELLRTLATRFDLVWATGWEHRANAYLPRLLGIADELPTLQFGKKAMWGQSEWKIKAISRYAGRRPAAWIDDHVGPLHERWAAHRSAPTKLVRTDPRMGITEEHVVDLLEWADSVAAQSAPTSRRAAARLT